MASDFLSFVASIKCVRRCKVSDPWRAPFFYPLFIGLEDSTLRTLQFMPMENFRLDFEVGIRFVGDSIHLCDHGTAFGHQIVLGRTTLVAWTPVIATALSGLPRIRPLSLCSRLCAREMVLTILTSNDSKFQTALVLEFNCKMRCDSAAEENFGKVRSPGIPRPDRRVTPDSQPVGVGCHAPNLFCACSIDQAY